MTREEAIKTFEEILQLSPTLDETGCSVTEAMKVALFALRPVSRERVEKMRGEWLFPIFVGQRDANDPRCQCSECGSVETPLARHWFCPSCGAPMTDEAVEILLKRLEALKDGKGD